MANDHDRLIYDGECGFCTSCVVWLERRQKPDSSMVPVNSRDLSDEDLRNLNLTREEVRRFVWLVGPNVHEKGSRAIGRCLTGLHGWWPVLGAFLRYPPTSWLGVPAYRVIANQRHHLSRRTSTCAVEHEVRTN
jgi:predicted DCC family thiol-disulfide oxidoreductase YuxK